MWQTQNEVKDKDALLKHRKSVENAMEKYKQVEKDSKHKAYSKEGLTQPEHLSPEEQERQDAIEYVKATLEELQIQQEGVEAEVAKLSLGGKKSRKGGLGPKEQERKGELDDSIEMFKFHQQSLELVLRLLQNGKLEADLVNTLRDDVKYFLENNQEPDFMFDDSIYEALELEDKDNILVHEVKSSFDGLNGADGREDESPEPESVTPVIPAGKLDLGAHKKEHSNGSFNTPPVHKSDSHKVIQKTPSPPPVTITLPPSATQLKPAAIPVRPAGEKNWAAAAAASLVNIPLVSKVHTPTELVNITPKNLSTNAPLSMSLNLQAHVDAAVQAGLETKSPPTAKHVTQKEIELASDLQVAVLPPGIQCFVMSAVKAENETIPSGGSITTAADLLVNSRKDLSLGFTSNLHPTQFAKLSAEWDAFRGQLVYDAQNNTILGLGEELLRADILVLFFGFYYGLTAVERSVAQRGLVRKNWRLHVNNLLWFYKLSPSTATTEKFEISNYEIFDAYNWTVKMISNYQLDFSQLVSSSV